MTQLFGNQFAGELVEFFDPYTVAVDLRLDVAVGRAAHSHTHGAACAVARHADHADVVSEILAAELCAETQAMGCLEKFFLEFDVTEGMSILISLCGKVVIIFYGGFLHCGKVGFGRSASDHERDVVGRTGGRAEGLHLLDEERHECLPVEDSFGFLIKICLVGRAATLCHEQEVVFCAFGGVDFNLCGEIAAGVHLVVHVERRVLRVAEIVLGVGLVDAFGNFLFVIAACPYLLAFVGGTYRCAGVLTEGEHALGGNLGIAEHGESHKLVVLRRFGVMENLGHHLVMLAAQHERAVVGTYIGQKGKGLGGDHKHLVAVPVLGFHALFGEELILGGVSSEREHFLIMKGFCCHISFFQ